MRTGDRQCRAAGRDAGNHSASAAAIARDRNRRARTGRIGIDRQAALRAAAPQQAQRLGHAGACQRRRRALLERNRIAAVIDKIPGDVRDGLARAGIASTLGRCKTVVGVKARDGIEIDSLGGHPVAGRDGHARRCGRNTTDIGRNRRDRV